jgi:LPS-assembly protein
LNGLRHQSPIVSILRVQTRVGLEWRSDYDPVRHAFVNSGMSVDARFRKIYASLGNYSVNTDPVLVPSSHQIRGQIQYGGDNQRGWNYGFATFYDYKLGLLQFSQAQITYNTDCCGFSVQYRRFNVATRGENQFRIAFAIANIGSFGTLRKQERIF